MAVLKVAVEATGANGQKVRLPAGARGLGGKPLGGTYGFTGGPGSQSELNDRNHTLALEAQRSIGDALEARILRPDVQTHRLLNATVDVENISWTREGFAVGNETFLKDSPAKYWRTIDEGTSHWHKPFVGSTFYVLKSRAFGATIAGFNDDASWAGPEWSRAGAATGGKMSPISRRNALAIIDDNGGALPRWLGQVTIHHDIAAKHYYERGFLDSGVIAKGVQSYKLYLRSLVQF